MFATEIGQNCASKKRNLSKKVPETLFPETLFPEIVGVKFDLFCNSTSLLRPLYFDSLTWTYVLRPFFTDLLEGLGRSSEKSRNIEKVELMRTEFLSKRLLQTLATKKTKF